MKRTFEYYLQKAEELEYNLPSELAYENLNKILATTMPHEIDLDAMGGFWLTFYYTSSDFPYSVIELQILNNGKINKLISYPDVKERKFDPYSNIEEFLQEEIEDRIRKATINPVEGKNSKPLTRKRSEIK